MAIYRDDDGSLYWYEDFRTVVRPPADSPWNSPYIHARLIHPHRMDKLARVGMVIGLTVLASVVMSLALTLRGQHQLAPLPAGLAMFIAGIGPLFLLSWVGPLTLVDTPLRLVSRPQQAIMLMDLALPLASIDFNMSLALNMLNRHPDSLWARVWVLFAVIIGLALAAQAARRLYILSRPDKLA